MVMEYRFERIGDRDAVRSMVEEVFLHGDAKRIYVYLDRNKNEFVATTSPRTAKALLFLGKVAKSKGEYDKKLLMKDKWAVVWCMDNKDLLTLNCKKTILSEFKKKVSKKELDECMEIAFVKYARNPHYRCAGNMELYCRATMEWLISQRTA